MPDKSDKSDNPNKSDNNKDPFNLHPFSNNEGRNDKVDNLGPNQGRKGSGEGNQRGRFPPVSPEEIEIILTSITSIGGKIIHICSDPNCPINSEDKEIREVATFAAKVLMTCIENKLFQTNFALWKHLLYQINRTTGLASAFTSGVAIGFLLASPSLIPTSSEVVDRQVEKIESYIKSLEMMEEGDKKGE